MCHLQAIKAGIKVVTVCPPYIDYIAFPCGHEKLEMKCSTNWKLNIQFNLYGTETAIDLDVAQETDLPYMLVLPWLLVSWWNVVRLSATIVQHSTLSARELLMLNTGRRIEHKFIPPVRYAKYTVIFRQ